MLRKAGPDIRSGCEGQGRDSCREISSFLLFVLVLWRMLRQSVEWSKISYVSVC